MYWFAAWENTLPRAPGGRLLSRALPALCPPEEALGGVPGSAAVTGTVHRLSEAACEESTQEIRAVPGKAGVHQRSL